MNEWDASYNNKEDDTISKENREVRDLLLLWLEYILQLPANQEFIVKLAEENDKKAFGRRTNNPVSSSTKTLKDELP